MNFSHSYGLLLNTNKLTPATRAKPTEIHRKVCARRSLSSGAFARNVNIISVPRLTVRGVPSRIFVPERAIISSAFVMAPVDQKSNSGGWVKGAKEAKHTQIMQAAANTLVKIFIKG